MHVMMSLTLPVRFPGRVRLAIDIDHRLLPEVNPKELLLIRVFLHYWFQAVAVTLDGGLAGSENRKTGQLKINLL